MATSRRIPKPIPPTPEQLAQYALEQQEGVFNNVSNQLLVAQQFIHPVFTQFQGMIASMMEVQGFWESANTGEKIALMHTELSEALEADRKSIESSEHIPDFTGVEEELADLVIRVLDFAGHHNLRLSEAIVAKTYYNLTRPFKHGKKY